MAKPQATTQECRCRCHLTAPSLRSAPTETTAPQPTLDMSVSMSGTAAPGPKRVPISTAKPQTTGQECRCRCHLTAPSLRSAPCTTPGTGITRVMFASLSGTEQRGNRKAMTLTAKPQATTQECRCRCHLTAPSLRSAPTETTAPQPTLDMSVSMSGTAAPGPKRVPISTAKPQTTGQECRCRCHLTAPSLRSAPCTTTAPQPTLVMFASMSGTEQRGNRKAMTLTAKPQATTQECRCHCHLTAPSLRSARTATTTTGITRAISASTSGTEQRGNRKVTTLTAKPTTTGREMRCRCHLTAPSLRSARTATTTTGITRVMSASTSGTEQRGNRKATTLTAKPT